MDSSSGSFSSDDTDVSIDHYDVVIGNLKHLRSDESFNDVQFSLRDGKVLANSVIMSMSSDYFATMISNEKFIEGQTKDIPMKEYGTKKAMESIVEYVYSGKMNLETHGFETPLEILNILKMMLMKTDKLSSRIEKYINQYVYRGDCYHGELLRGYLLVERYCLENIRNSVVRKVHFCIKRFVDKAKAKASTKEVLQQFSVKLIKEILL